MSSDCPQRRALSWSAGTDPGRFRKNNEDAFLALAVDGEGFEYLGKVGEARIDRGDFVFAVSDGMGGANAGEFASRIAVQKIAELLPASFRMGAYGMSEGKSDVLIELFQRIHSEMTKMSLCYEECRGMGATLSMGWISPEWLSFCHIGDSRVYYLPAAGGLKQLTVDHTHVGWLRYNGKLNEREERSHPQRNVLHQVLGGKVSKIDPQLGSVGYEEGDRFLFCSDGIVDGIWDHRIESLLRSPMGEWSEIDPGPRLVEYAKRESGRDNLTAVVVEMQ